MSEGRSVFLVVSQWKLDIVHVLLEKLATYRAISYPW